MEWDKEDDEFGGGPLPLDDRLWRHPSELAASHPPPDGSTRPLPPWGGVLAGFLLGSVVVGAVWLGFAHGRTDLVRVTEQVAMTPVVAVPQPASAIEWSSAVQDRASPTLVQIEAWPEGNRLISSGVIIRDDGMILTAAQAVADENSVRVSFSNGSTQSASVVGVDWISGIAMIDVEGTGYTSAVLSPRRLVPDQSVVVLGWDTAAIPSRITETQATRHDPEGRFSLVGVATIATPLDTSWTGSAVLADTGAVTGIVSVLEGDEALIIALDSIDSAIDQLEQGGIARHASLAVEATDDDLESGARLVSVLPDGAAALAGLEPGDVVQSIDGVRVASTADMVVAVRSHEPGHAVRVKYKRSGETLETTVVLESRS